MSQYSFVHEVCLVAPNYPDVVNQLGATILWYASFDETGFFALIDTLLIPRAICCNILWLDCPPPELPIAFCKYWLVVQYLMPIRWESIWIWNKLNIMLIWMSWLLIKCNVVWWVVLLSSWSKFEKKRKDEEILINLNLVSLFYVFIFRPSGVCKEI